MRRLTVIVLALFAWPSLVDAACEGQDYRNVLPVEAMREIRASVEHVPYREGIAFEAVRGDRRLTLFGTVHTSHPAVFIPEEIAARIRAADLVLLEAPMEMQAEIERKMGEDPSIMFDFAGPGLRARLTAREQDILSEAFSAMGIDPDMGDKMRPWFAALMLEVPPCEMAALEQGAKLLDDRVEALAREAGVAVGGLDEDLEQALSFFVDAPEEKQLHMLRLSLAAGGVANDDLIATGVGGWVDEEFPVVWEVGRAHAVSLIGEAAAVDELYDLAYELLVVDRNRSWLTRILRRIEGVRTIVIAVGGLHLPGDQGLLRLLEAEGFAIRRLAVL